MVEGYAARHTAIRASAGQIAELRKILDILREAACGATCSAPRKKISRSPHNKSLNDTGSSSTLNCATAPYSTVAVACRWPHDSSYGGRWPNTRTSSGPSSTEATRAPSTDAQIRCTAPTASVSCFRRPYDPFGRGGAAPGDRSRDRTPSKATGFSRKPASSFRRQQWADRNPTFSPRNAGRLRRPARWPSFAGSVRHQSASRRP